MNPQMKKLLYGILAVVLIVVAVIWMVASPTKQIEDINGTDNYDLATITDADIIAYEMGSVGLGRKTGVLTAATYYSDQYSGVDLLEDLGLCSKGMTISVNHTSVTAGNFCFAVVVNGQIVHKFEHNQLIQSYTTEEAGEVYLVIAGESAAFSFDYEVY